MFFQVNTNLYNSLKTSTSQQDIYTLCGSDHVQVYMNFFTKRLEVVFVLSETECFSHETLDDLSTMFLVI